MASPNSTSEEAEDFHSKISFILPSPWYFQSHTAPVNSIATVNSNEIFTGSRDGTIRQFKRTNSPLPESIVISIFQIFFFFEKSFPIFPYSKHDLLLAYYCLIFQIEFEN